MPGNIKLWNYHCVHSARHLLKQKGASLFSPRPMHLSVQYSIQSLCKPYSQAWDWELLDRCMDASECQWDVGGRVMA